MRLEALREDSTFTSVWIPVLVEQLGKEYRNPER